MTRKNTAARARSGSVYQQGRVWWISCRGADGKRRAESSEGGTEKGQLLSTRFSGNSRR